MRLPDTSTDPETPAPEPDPMSSPFLEPDWERIEEGIVDGDDVS
jgi:hypothetical protein